MGLIKPNTKDPIPIIVHSSFEKIKPNGEKKKKVAVSFSSERNPNFTYSIIFFVCLFVPPGRRQPLNWSRNGEVDQGRFRIDEEEEEDNDDYEY